MGRVNPFENPGEAPVFETKPKAPAVAPEKIDQIAQENNFPSRQARANKTPAAPKRKHWRRKTGRTEQLNIKTTAEAIDRFYEIANVRRWTLGEAFEKAVEALGQTE